MAGYGGGGGAGHGYGGSYGGGGTSTAGSALGYDDDDLKRRSRIITRMFPALKKKPKFVISLAQQDVADDELATQVAKSAGFSIVQNRASKLVSLKPETQHELWNSFDPTMRTLLKKSGYRLPKEGGDGGGGGGDFWGDFVGGAIDVAKAAGGAFVSPVTLPAQAVASVAGHPIDLPDVGDSLRGVEWAAQQVEDKTANVPVVSNAVGAVSGGIRTASKAGEEYVAAPVLAAMNTVGGIAGQYYRANQTFGGDEPHLSTSLGDSIGSITQLATPFVEAVKAGYNSITGNDPAQVKHFVNAWEEAAHPNSAFNRRSVEHARELLSGNESQLDIAKQIAGGSDMEEIAAKYGDRGTRKYEDAYLQLSGLSASDNFNRALKTLNSGLISPGGDTVRAYGMDPTSTPGRELAMIGDGLFQWYTDPLLVAGKIRHAWKAAEAIKTVENVEAWRGFEAAKIAAVHGDDWERLDLTAQEFTKLGAPRHAMAQTYVDSIRSGATATELGNTFATKYPKMGGILPALMKEDRELKIANENWYGEHLGRPLTVAEAASVPGLYNADDVWNFFQKKEGLIEIVKGTYQPGRTGIATLPKLTRAGRFSAETKLTAKKVIEWAAQGDEMRAVPLQSDDVVGAQATLVGSDARIWAPDELVDAQGFAKHGLSVSPNGEVRTQGGQLAGYTTQRAANRAASAAVPGVAEGNTRLYRVQIGMGPRDVNPADITSHSPYWFTTDLTQAQIAGMPLRQYGMVRAVDVPTGMLDDFAEGTNGGHILPPQIANTSTELGPTGAFAIVNGKVLPKPIRLLLNPPARMLQALTRQIPPDEIIKMYGPDFPKQLSSLLDMSHTDMASKNEIFGQIMRADNPAIRRELVRSVYDRMFFMGGLHETKAGPAIIEKYSNAVYQQYAENGLDLMYQGATSAPHGLLPFGDHADQIALPRYRDVQAAGKKIGVIEHLFGAINQPWADVFTSHYWSPAMLLKPAFPIRAGSDEGMATVLRSPNAYTTRWGMKLAFPNPEQASLNQRLFDASTEQGVLMSDEALRSDDIRTKFADILTSKATGWHRGLGMKMIPPELRRAAMLVSEQPELKRANMAGLSQVTARRATYGIEEIGELPPGAVYIPTDIEGTQFKVLFPAGSAFGTYSAGQVEHLPSIWNGTHRFLHEPVGTELVNGRHLYVSAQKEQAIYGAFSRAEVGGIVAFENADDGYAIAGQIRAELKAAPRFRRAFTEALGTKYTGADAEVHATARAKMAAEAGDSDVLRAVVDNFDALPRGAGYTLLLDPETVVKRLIRPEVEMDEIQRLQYGNALDNNPVEALNELFQRLPNVEPGYMRWYVPYFDDASEIRASERMLPAQYAQDITADEPLFHEIWAPATYEEEQIKEMILGNLDRAKKGVDPGMRGLSYVDIPFGDVTPSSSMLSWAGLPVRYREAALPFADDIGTQLDDIKAWHSGVDTERIKRWQQLAEEALNGNEASAYDLGVESTLRAMEHPVNARWQREMMRGNMHSTDGPVIRPPRDGMVTVYFPTFHTADADTARMAVNRGSAVGRRFLDTELNMPDATRELESLGHGPQFPISQWASTDMNEVKGFISELEDSAKQVNQPIKIGMKSVEVSDSDIRKFFKTNPGAGTHDYEMDLGTSFRGVPIDLEGPLANALSPKAEEMLHLNDMLDHQISLAQEAVHRNFEHTYELAMNEEELHQIELEHQAAVENVTQDLTRAFQDPLHQEMWHDTPLLELLDRHVPGWETDPKWYAKFSEKLHRELGTYDPTIDGLDAEMKAIHEANRAAIIEAHDAGMDPAFQNMTREEALAAHQARMDNASVHNMMADEGYRDAQEEMLYKRHIDPNSPTPYDDFKAKARVARTPHVTWGNGVTVPDAYLDHAHKLNDRFDQLFTNNGEIIHELTVRGAMEKGVNPDWVYAEGIPLPNQVTGPRLYDPGDENVFNKIVRWGFDGFTTPIVDAMNRTPLWTYNFLHRVTLGESLLRPVMVDAELVKAMAPIAKKLGTNTDEVYDLFARANSNTAMAEHALEEGMTPHRVYFKADMARVEHYVELGALPENILHLSEDEWTTVHRFMDHEANIRSTVADSAAYGAEGDTIPFIDDHRVRSQFAEKIRNLSPFWWAQEAFFRRWGRTLAHSPEAIRKGQLMMQGARHAGLTYEGPDGKQHFMIPFTQQLWETVQNALHPILGSDMPVIPVPVGISGDVRLASPGFDAIGVPGFSSFVGIPLALARPHFPEVGAVEEGLLGDQGANRGIIDQLLPAWANRVYRAINAHPESDAQMSSAMIQGMQYLEAHDLAPGDKATAPEKQRYIDRMESWAKSLLIFRAVFGMFDPAPPVLEVGDVNLTPEFVKLFQNLPFDEAMGEFIKRHPDATPYTVFQTKAKAGATMSGTADAGKFLTDNDAFVKKYPLASSWMMPQPNSNDINVRHTYQIQQEYGLRERKTPAQWYEDMKFAQSSDAYFNSSERYERARSKLTDASDKADLDRSWSNWKTDYFLKHPMFAETLQSSDGIKRRQAVIDETNLAMADPDLPDFAHQKELRALMNSYNRFDTAMSRLKGLRGNNASEDRDSLRASFSNWALGYVKAHPRVRSFWERTLDPQVALSVVDKERLGVGTGDSEVTKSSAQPAAGPASPVAAQYASAALPGAVEDPATKVGIGAVLPGSPDQMRPPFGEAEPGAHPSPEDLRELRRLQKKQKGKGDITITPDGKWFTLPGGKRVPTPSQGQRGILA